MLIGGEMGNKKIRLSLAFYDLIIFSLVAFALFWWYRGFYLLTLNGFFYQFVLALVLIFSTRFVGKIYRQIWRYGGIQCYIRLLICDTISGILYLFIERLLPIPHIPFIQLVAFCSMNCLGSLAIRMLYRYAYKFGGADNKIGRFLRFCIRIVAGKRVRTEQISDTQKIKIAIIGAGNVGISLADELLNNKFYRR